MEIIKEQKLERVLDYPLSSPSPMKSTSKNLVNESIIVSPDISNSVKEIEEIINMEVSKNESSELKDVEMPFSHTAEKKLSPPTVSSTITQEFNNFNFKVSEESIAGISYPNSSSYGPVITKNIYRPTPIDIPV